MSNIDEKPEKVESGEAVPAADAVLELTAQELRAIFECVRTARQPVSTEELVSIAGGSVGPLLYAYSKLAAKLRELAVQGK